MNHKHERIIIVTRHGEQCPQRGLTQRGEEQVQSLAIALDVEGYKPDLILPSFPKRTLKSAAILQRYFQSACEEPMNFLDTYQFDMKQFFDALSPDAQTTLIAGHDETIQCFGYHLLDDSDASRLFSQLPENRKMQHDFNDRSILAFKARHADALIFRNTLDNPSWILQSLIIDGQIIVIDKENTPAVQGRIYSAIPDFPEIILEFSE